MCAVPFGETDVKFANFFPLHQTLLAFSPPVTSQWIFQNQTFVLIVDNDVVTRIPLRKGLSNKDYFEVLNPEITENSLVIVQGKGLVKPGQTVKTVLNKE